MEIVIVIWVLCSVGSYLIGTSKGYDGFISALAGLVLGIFGILIMALVPKKVVSGAVDVLPAGVEMVTVTCKRCNAVQNIPNGFAFKCWQCNYNDAVLGGVFK